MTKGRNTTTISVRVPDEWYNLINEYAAKKHITKQDWLKPIIKQALAISKRLSVNES